MNVEVRNPNATPLTLSGYAEIPPGGIVEMPAHIAHLYRKSIEIIPREIPEEKHIELTCSFHPTDGYGIGSSYLARALLARGYYLSFNAPRMLHPLIDDDLLSVMASGSSAPARVGLARTIPSLFKLNGAAYRVGWTMWESTRLPSHWVEACNEMDELIVPTTSIARVFEESGVTVPLRIIPEPINLDDYTFVERSLDEPFTFVSVSRMCSRKCPLETVECFQRAFPHERDVRLIMKTRDHQFGAGSFGVPNMHDERITIVDEDWPLPRIVQLLHRAHAGVFLSHGEGFYHGPVQAMATGLPTIVPDHSGCSDYCDPKFNFPVPLHPTNPLSETTYFRDRKISFEPAEWYELDYDAVVEQMRSIYQNREHALAVGKRSAKWVRKRYSVDKTVDAFEKIVIPKLS